MSSGLGDLTGPFMISALALLFPKRYNHVQNILIHGDRSSGHAVDRPVVPLSPFNTGKLMCHDTVPRIGIYFCADGSGVLGDV